MKEDIFHLGIKALIRNKKGQILILNTNLKTFKGHIDPHWDLPGGRIQKNESIEEALAREIEEEIGIQKIKIIRFLDASISKMRITNADAGLILFTYLCKIDNSAYVKLTDNEHTEFKWCAPKEAAKLLKIKFSDSLVEIVKKL